MSKDLISRVIQRSADVSPETAIRAANDVVDAIVHEVQTSGMFLLPSLGTLTVQKSNTRKGGRLVAPDVASSGQPQTRAPTETDLVRMVAAILSRWDISGDTGLTILGSPAKTFDDLVRSGDAALDTRDMRDRARLLFDIYEGVYALLQDPPAERHWIRTPRPDLDGGSVMDLMAEGSQRNLIRALAFVDHVNGR